MKLCSTKNPSHQVNLKSAVLDGLARDGGLYMPTEIPKLPSSFFDNLGKMSFQEMSLYISKALLGNEIPEKDLQLIIEDSINFDAPLNLLTESLYILELFHGPTLAFKDFGARFMSRIMRHFYKDNEQEIVILAATSGDTGSAVAHGFLNVPGIKVVLLYPSGKVSEIQEKQITTVGGNVTALEIEGAFDDCQRMVKEVFMNQELSEKILLSSANSINIARLIAQIFYYFRAFSQLSDFDKVIVSVPSGNFGNLTAGLFAKKMGLPIYKFIASTNINDVVPEYLKTSIFRPRPSVPTISNAMDVGNPSNFERILSLYEGDINLIRNDILGATFTDDETRNVIKNIKEETDYLIDPHGAVAYLGLKKYMEKNNELFTGIALGTAHPAKFLDVIEPVINEKVIIPERLQNCLNKPKKSIKLSANTSSLIDFLLQ